MKVKVECTLIVEVDWPDDLSDPHFQIEENGCPGTGRVGAVIAAAIERGEVEQMCWACALQGKNRIRMIDGRIAETASPRPGFVREMREILGDALKSPKNTESWDPGTPTARYCGCDCHECWSGIHCYKESREGVCKA